MEKTFVVLHQGNSKENTSIWYAGQDWDKAEGCKPNKEGVYLELQVWENNRKMRGYGRCIMNGCLMDWELVYDRFIELQQSIEKTKESIHDMQERLEQMEIEIIQCR